MWLFCTMSMAPIWWHYGLLHRWPRRRKTNCWQLQNGESTCRSALVFFLVSNLFCSVSEFHLCIKRERGGLSALWRRRHRYKKARLSISRTIPKEMNNNNSNKKQHLAGWFSSPFSVFRLPLSFGSKAWRWRARGADIPKQKKTTTKRMEFFFL